MKIIDEHGKESVNVGLGLTIAEAERLQHVLGVFLKDPVNFTHMHINDLEHKKEITVWFEEEE